MPALPGGWTGTWSGARARCRTSSACRRNISATNVWFTTQPVEEPEKRDHLADVIDWVGWDRLLFATDYPHWDFDDPSRALPAGVSDANRDAFYLNNALKLYGLA